MIPCLRARHRYHILFLGVIFFAVIAEKSDAQYGATLTPRLPAMVGRVPAQQQTMPAAKPLKPAPKLAPLPPPADKSMPARIPVFPTAKAVAFQPMQSKDNRYIQIANYVASDPFERVVEFYSPSVTGEQNAKGLVVVKIPPQARGSQGWFKNLTRGEYKFRVFLMTPAVNPATKSLDPKVTSIQYFMEAS